MSIPKPESRPDSRSGKPFESLIRDVASEAASQMETAAAHVEQDLKRVLSYINDEVMPDVRRNGSVALRAAALELQRLAHRMEDASRPPVTPPPRRSTTDR